MLLIHFLQHAFKLYFRNTMIAPDFFQIGAVDFYRDEAAKNKEGFLGFFDWLRTADGSIAGIRISYFDDLPYSDMLRQYPYVRSVNDGKSMELLFKPVDYIPDQSRDQDFSNNHVYRSAAGEYLFTFDLDELSDLELLGLADLCEAMV